MTEKNPIINFTGEKVVLGPVTREALPLFLEWMNDIPTRIRNGSSLPGPVMSGEEDAWFEHLRKPDANPQFLIREKSTNRVIGTTGLPTVDQANRKASFAIMIGDIESRGKGYGTDATRLMLDFAFTVGGLHSINLYVAEFNLAGQRAYLRAGFRECGRLRESWYAMGRYWDTIYMDCLASEFESPYLKDQIGPDLKRD